jgi:hypothetical protein
MLSAMEPDMNNIRCSYQPCNIYVLRKEKQKGEAEHFFIYRIMVSVLCSSHSLSSLENGMDDTASVT